MKRKESPSTKIYSSNYKKLYESYMTFERTHLSLSYSLTLSFGNFHEINRRKSLNWTKEIGKFPTDIFKIVINHFLRKANRVFGIRRVRWLRIQLLLWTVKELKSVQFCIARGYERQRRARNATTTMQTLPLATAIVRGIMSR